MTQNNFRKEPIFGEPSVTSQETEQAETTNTATTQAPYVSLRSTKAPGHTFTPIMKRPDAKVEDHTADVFSAKQAKEFQFTPSSEATEAVEPDNTVSSDEESVSTASFNTVEAQENVEKDVVKPASESFTTERIIPNAATTAAAAATAAVTATKTKEIKAKMPPKTRRLLLVALLALALLALFFLLKPSTPETVEELQSQQGGSLPIEFRPVDEAEAKRAEEQARAEQEAAEAAKAQEQASQQEPAVAPTQTEQTMAKPAQNSQPQTQSQAVVEQPVAVKPVENKPVVAQPAIKPKTENSVVFQPETTVKQQPKTQAKPEVKTERVVPTQKEVAKTVAKPAVEKAPVKTETLKAAPATESANAVATKTMTVPKGVSLMQVFRDNNLNISDVNAMSKVNNVVSNLKVGERVTVRLDKNNRVVEMSIGSGGKFTRQANGSYTFK
ncbi:TPA: opacity-associated protein A [Mannheimia haemolytica]|nr:opacity-associated protein A [Mannheimia haemolytica]